MGAGPSGFPHNFGLGRVYPEAVERSEEDAATIVTLSGTRTDGGSPSKSDPDEGLTPLFEKLVIDLTAHRTAGLRYALAQASTLSLTVAVHAVALQVFYPPYDQPTALQLRWGVLGLKRFAPGVQCWRLPSTPR
jgi:ParB family chromosome partitioning protein